MAKRAAKAESAPTEAASETNGVPQADLAERVGQRVGNFTSKTLRGVFRVIGRVREEAEDVWAEAQALRHKEVASQEAKEG